MKAFIVVIIAALLAFGVGLYFGTARQGAQIIFENPANTAPAPDSGTASTTASVATTTEDDIAVSAWDYGFTPSVITVKKGDHVKIELTDAGGLHDFIIDEFNAKTPRLDTGATTTVEFDANLAGTFQYYSSVGNNRANGMWGNLIVTD